MLSALALAAPAQDAAAGAAPRADFQQAVEAYGAGDFGSAETLWRALLDAPSTGGEALDPADVLYNLGNAAWRQERPLEAAAWYTACLRLAPRHADAWANLEFVRAAAGVEPADRGDLTSTTRRLLFALTRAESEWLALACAALFALSLCGEALRGGALWRRLAAGTGVALLAGLAPWAAHLARGDARALLVVAADGGAVRSEPSAAAALVGRFPAGAEVRGIDALPGWVRAEAGNTQGWVEAAALRPLTAPYRLAP
jgi:tetratricopeptide (TPR) repeat protein